MKRADKVHQVAEVKGSNQIIIGSKDSEKNKHNAEQLWLNEYRKSNIVQSSWNLWYFVLITGKQILVYYTNSHITRFHPFGITKNN